MWCFMINTRIEILKTALVIGTGIKTICCQIPQRTARSVREV